MKPTGVLTTSEAMAEDPVFHEGWPTFDANDVYTGPLPVENGLVHCTMHDEHEKLIGKKRGSWKTTPTAFYKEGLCTWFALRMFWGFLDRKGLPRLPGTPSGSGAVPPLTPPPVEARDAARDGPASATPAARRGADPARVVCLDSSVPRRALGPEIAGLLGELQGLKPRRGGVRRRAVFFGTGLDAGGGACVEGGFGPSRKLVLCLNTFVRDVLRERDTFMQWNALVVEVGACEDRAAEEQRVGRVAVFGFGPGGRIPLVVWSSTRKVEADVAAELVVFDSGLSWSCGRSRTASDPVFLVTAFQHPARDTLDPGQAGFLKSLGFVLDEPRAWAPPVRVGMHELRGRGAPAIYIGRRGRARTLPSSVWGLPYTAERPGGRAEALALYRRRLATDPELRAALPALEGRRLACLCDPTQLCHGDLIIDEFRKLQAARCTAHTLAPPTDTAALAEASRRREAKPVPMARKLQGRQSPTRQAGVGSPVYVGRGARRRLFADGGGLCSPGLWHPDARLEPNNAGIQLREALVRSLFAFGESVPGGLPGLAGRLYTGQVEECPFDKPLLAAGRRAVEAAVGPHMLTVSPPEAVQPSEVDFLLLGSLARALDDPDWEVCPLLARGVPVGLGVDLPRTPEVFPPKVSWSLPEQTEWGGESSRAADFVGIVRTNYPSAREFERELRAALDDQTGKGFMVRMTVGEAREKYGDRLTVASLSALEKKVGDDGTREIRILHDGTNGVDLNRFILVLDAVPCPMAADLQASMRQMPDERAPITPAGLALDAKEAHRLIPVREEDWGL